MSLPDTLSDAALEWALTNINRFGDTDIFPIPFEFLAIKHDWAAIKKYLSTCDLSNYVTGPTVRKLVPKPSGGFRIVLQMDPLDAIVYAALVYESGALIESWRIPNEREIACSYRLNIQADGTLFSKESGWPKFHTKSETLSNRKECKYVAVADITDFYNQINLHRVENALEQAGVDEKRAKSIEAFLLDLSAKQSRGLPIGPYPSIVMAEATLNDIDTFLARHGHTHVRYVDDFRVFCNSRSEAIMVLHKLTEYLYTAHRLSLSAAKTKILSVNEFRRNELSFPEQTTQFRIAIEIHALRFPGYPDDQEPNIDEDEIALNTLRDLFRECVSDKPLNLGMSRYLLRTAKARRTNVLADIASSNLGRLTPVFRDVAEYLKTKNCIPREKREEIGNRLLDFLNDGNFGKIPYIRMWGLDILTNAPYLDTKSRAFEVANNCIGELGIRPIALLARRDQFVDWVREHKETWRNLSPWDKRAVIYASSILPKDERRSWLKLVIEAGNPLEQAVAKFASN